MIQGGSLIPGIIQQQLGNTHHIHQDTNAHTKKVTLGHRKFS